MIRYKVVLLPIGDAKEGETLEIYAHDVDVDSVSSAASGSAQHIFYNFLGEPDKEGDSVTFAAIPANHVHYVTRMP